MNSKLYRDKYNFGGLREKVIQRDKEKCLHCGMTRQDHKKKWKRDITVDHIEGIGVYDKFGGKRNTMDNLQTLCLVCHSKKDRLKATPAKGEFCTQHKLTIKDIIEARDLKRKGYTFTELAVRYEVAESTISRAVQGIQWKEIPNPVVFSQKKRVYVYSKNGKLFQEYETVTMAAKSLGVSTGNISSSAKYGWKVKGFLVIKEL